MYYFVLFCLTLFLDQLSKIVVLKELVLISPVKIFPFLNLVLVFNTGVSFSLFSSDSPYHRYLLAFISLVIVCVLFFWFLKEKNKITKYALILTLSGAVGNIIDRLRVGAVVDFIDVFAGKYHWPAFNLADSFICIGVALLFFSFYTESQKTKLQHSLEKKEVKGESK
jgi:signal peptidase II